jgi:uncharacterized repeat protein (TIGR01451 family)
VDLPDVCLPHPVTGPATVTCDVPVIAADGRISSTVNLRTTVLGNPTFTLAIPTLNDADTSNNSASQSTTVVEGADLALTLVVPATAPAGGTVNLTFTATNRGPNVASAQTVTFPIPTGLINLVAPAGCVLNGSSYAYLIPGPIAVGDSVA